MNSKSSYVKSKNCYSNADHYGSHGYNPIIPPKPVSTVSSLLNLKSKNLFNTINLCNKKKM